MLVFMTDFDTSQNYFWQQRAFTERGQLNFVNSGAAATNVSNAGPLREKLAALKGLLVGGASRRRAAPRSQFIGRRQSRRLGQAERESSFSTPCSELELSCCRVTSAEVSPGRKARPNPSLNRTLHSLPAFGLKKPSPNAVNLFRAG